jgi:Fe-S-cluster containining protein
MVDTNIGIDTVSFHCRACGKCCNSAPLMSVGELFHHERLFVGCLALRKVKRHSAGDTLSASGSHYRLSAEDARLLDDLNDAQLFKIGPTDSYYLSIMTQAMDYEALNRCPALNENQGCSIHEDRKPAVCSMVPFDSLYPDSLQNIVLLSRRFDENCIVTGQPDGYQLVVANRQVANQSFRVVLQNRRDDLMREKQLWGNTVFQTLRTELLCHPEQAAKIPADDSAVLLSITPVLQVLASLSESLRARCLRYVDSQICLLDEKVLQAIARKSAADKQTTRTFRSFKEHYLILRPQLATLKPNMPFFRADRSIESLEKFLGV